MKIDQKSLKIAKNRKKWVSKIDGFWGRLLEAIFHSFRLQNGTKNRWKSSPERCSRSKFRFFADMQNLMRLPAKIKVSASKNRATIAKSLKKIDKKWRAEKYDVFFIDFSRFLADFGVPGGAPKCKKSKKACKKACQTKHEKQRSRRGPWSRGRRNVWGP